MTSTYSKRTSQSGSAQAPADNLDKAADYGRDAAEGAKAIASEATASVKTEMRKILDQQIEHGSAYLGHAASSIRTAADDLSKNAPPLAGLADTVADKLDGYAESMKGKTAEDLWDSAVDFTRRQPGLVFGLASLAGFLAYRTIKSTQPARTIEAETTAKEFHGA
jgi:hypothetical protein